MAKNRYGWQKRAKEIARKQKHDDKLKRRQSKAAPLAEEELPDAPEEALDDLVEIDAIASNFKANPSPQD